MKVTGNDASHGIPWCMNCTGFHPDEYPTQVDMVQRMLRPQSVILRQAARFEKKIALYRKRVCCLCGRAYTSSGELDDTWDLTARFVKMEFEHAGLYSVEDSDIKKVVASCREAVIQLFKHIPNLQYAICRKGQFSKDDYDMFERLTFAGRLNTIIELALEGRRIKLAGVESRL